MRLFAVFDWLICTQRFLTTGPEPPCLPARRAAAQMATQHLSFDQVRSTDSDKPSELKLNLSDCEIIFVDRTDSRDANAVILRGTAIFACNPTASGRIANCSLNSLEAFSCCLACEDETALSIIDPTDFTVEVTRPDARRGGGGGGGGSGLSLGLLDAKETQQPVIEVLYTTLSIRFSYRDFQLIASILGSLPSQAMRPPGGQQQPQQRSPPSASRQWSECLVYDLMQLGFDPADCRYALGEAGGDLQLAALLLTDPNRQADAAAGSNGADSDPLAELGRYASEIQVKCSGGNGCGSAVSCVLIDDYQDCDFRWSLEGPREGRCSATLMVNYFNRDLSANSLLNANLTKHMLDLYESAQKRIYQTRKESSAVTIATTATTVAEQRSTALSARRVSTAVGSGRRRSPFVPFRLVNRTGCDVHYKVQTRYSFRDDTAAAAAIAVVSAAASAGSSQVAGQEVREQTQLHCDPDWRRLAADAETAIELDAVDGKRRHESTHDYRVHRLAVQLEGWEPCEPICIDRVGTFFRDTAAPPGAAAAAFSAGPAGRLVFNIVRNSTAQKIITLRSALTFTNRLHHRVELQLRSHEHFEPSGARSFHLEPGDCLPVPIRYIADCAFRVRPAVSERWSVDFARESVDWRRAVKPMERRDALCACRYRGADDDILDSNAGPTGPDYHLVTSVLRENFPADIVGQSVALPGHSVFIEPPVCLVNLLPQDLSYHLPMLSVKGRVASGQEDHLHLLDSKRDLLLQLHLENFRCPEPLRIPWQARRQTLCLTMHDWNDKQLDLMVKLESRAQGPIRITVSACYWLINRTGLPLIIKQTYDDGGPLAGQGDEHEAARCVAPLLFSLSAVGGEVGGAGASGNGGWTRRCSWGGGGGGSGRYCSLRLGRHWQPAGGAAAAAAAKGGYSRWTPLWCEHFHPDSPGCIVRQLHMKPADQSLPNLVYSIGLEMRPGRGRYRHTNIITCTSRYQLHNRSSHVLAYAQRHCTGSVEHTITGPPTSYQAFHWTRDDKDKLLCVRLADQRHQPDAACAWSGGFRIDEVASFHVLLRSAAAGGAHLATRAPHFLRVEVTVHRSTFHVIFSDIDNLPLPYRIDNRSRVPVTYRQTQAGAELRSVVRPGASAPYALDEPALKPHITLSIPGGSCATYDMNCVSAGEQLRYETLYDVTLVSTVGTLRELVLDCDSPDLRLLLGKKVDGKRSQLWRWQPVSDNYGIFIHEGTMPPRDPRQPKSEPLANCYALDVDCIASRPSKPGHDPLRLAKRDVKRAWTSRPGIYVSIYLSIY
uniref:UBA domain-containing protein n=1 Tax=Macrostomum lignano TaxID=282301 RepID=A0A1I8IH62_9PLAT